ncbi:B30.2/SPRY domain-containing protein [Entamoeba marina]
MVYLMKISFHLQTFENVLNFLLTCKNAKNAIKSLKINPFFGNRPSLEKFMKHFKVETITCDIHGYFSPILYENVKYIRDPTWENFKEEDEEIVKELLPKITVLDLDYSINNSDSNRVKEFFIKEAIQFTNLQKVEGAIEYIVKFFENYTQKGEMMYVNFPKRIIINESMGYSITFNKGFLNQMKQLLPYIPNNGLTTIDVIVYENPPEKDKDLLKELLQFQRVNYYYEVVTPNQTISYENCLYCENGNALVDRYVNGDRFNNIFEKSYTTTCVIRNLEDSKEAPVWNVPKCISNIEIYGSKPSRFTTIKLFNSDISMIRELLLKDVRNVNFPSTLFNLVKIKVEKSSYCVFNLKSPKLEYISLSNVKNCSFTNSINTVKEIVISKVNNCFLPFVSFENRSIHIEDSNNLYFCEKEINFLSAIERKNVGDNDDDDNSDNEDDNNSDNEKEDDSVEEDSVEEEDDDDSEEDDDDDSEDDSEEDDDDSKDNEIINLIEEDQEIIGAVRSPLEFMGIGLNDFNQLTTNCLIYPSEVDLKTLLKNSSIFKMRTFHPQTSRVKVEGNTIKRIIHQGEDGVDLVVSSKFYVKNDNLMTVNPNDPECPIPSIIRYFEIETQNYCFISIGLIDSTIYEFEEDNQVGWEIGSIGYHSDDGALFNENGTLPIENYGKAYGRKNGEKNVVGCGYNIVTNEVFFTVNGTKLQPQKIYYDNISAAIGLAEFDLITINYGDSPFVFDYYGEIEKCRQELYSKLDYLK